MITLIFKGRCKNDGTCEFLINKIISTALTGNNQSIGGECASHHKSQNGHEFFYDSLNPLVVKEKDGFKMENTKRILVVGLLINLIIFGFLANTTLAGPGIYYGRVVGFVFTNLIQVEEENGRISVFWLGHRTHLDSRVPFLGDRGKFEYAKDRLGRNAVTRITVMRRK